MLEVETLDINPDGNKIPVEFWRPVSHSSASARRVFFFFFKESSVPQSKHSQLRLINTMKPQYLEGFNLVCSSFSSKCSEINRGLLSCRIYHLAGTEMLPRDREKVKRV